MEIARHLLLFLMWTLALTTQVYGVRVFQNITLLESAVAKGAVCLDGTPPAYVYSKGYGEGVNNWIVYIQGGGWCFSLDDCRTRSMSHYGSSEKMMAFNTHFPIQFDGMLDDNATYNPLFYNWNIFYILYCDGSSFMSNIDQEINIKGKVIYFRGARIYDAMVEELFLNKGIANAQHVILTGSSAGGLTTILHCDKFRAQFSQSTTVKCISDSGFFIHGEGLIGAGWREEQYFNVVSVHGLANSLPTSCTTRMNPALCLFPENIVNDIQTPLFLVESAFDMYQIQHLIPPNTSAGWNICDQNSTTIISECNWTQYKIMKDFRATFIQTLKSLDSSSSIGYFVHSCYAHGHVWAKETWTCSSLAGHNVLANKAIGQAIGDWYFNQSSFREIDMQNDLPRNCDVILSQIAFNQQCMEFLQHA